MSANSPLSRPLWAIVAAAASIAAIGMGLRQVVGLYLKPMSMDLAIGREDFALSVAIANIVWGLAAPFTGAVADRYGAGRVVLMGGLATGAGLFLMWGAQSAADLYAAGVFLGLGVAGAGINALVGTVGRAAGAEERTRAIAVIGMGSGIGILVALPYTHLLMDSIGWRGSLAVLAATAMLILPLAAIVRGRPGTPARHDDQALGAALRESFAQPGFWLLNASFFVCGFHVVFYGTHLPAYVADLDLEPWVAVAALMAVGIGNLAGTYLAGEWGRVLPKRNGLALIYGGRAFVFLAFLSLPPTAFTIIGLSAVLGLLWLSTVPLTSGLVGVMFGAQWMTMLYGIVFLSHQAGSFLGAWLGGVVFDRFQSYDAMWWISAGLGLAAALLSLPISERPVERLRSKTA